MFKLEDSLWWYVAMRRIVRTIFDASLPANGARLQILDAGSGTGGSLSLLHRYGQVTSFDFSEKAAEMYRTRESGRILVASTDAIPFADASFDLVTSFDVICQLESPADEAALREMARVLRPGGSFFVRVPANQALYGPHDKILHTQHRYSAGELAAKIEAAGLQVVRTTYANTWLFPVALARRLLARLNKNAAAESDVRPVPSLLNAALQAVLSSEAEIIKRTRLPLGLSVMALARKP